MRQPTDLTKTVLKGLLWLASLAGTFVLGQIRGDAVQDNKIQQLELQQKGMVTRAEFVLYAEGMREQLKAINGNIEGLRQDMREERNAASQRRTRGY